MEDGVAARMRGRGVRGKWRLGKTELKKFKCFDRDEKAKKWLSGPLNKWQVLKCVQKDSAKRQILSGG